MNNVRTKSEHPNKLQALLKERVTEAKTKLPPKKPRKDKTEARAKYMARKEAGVDCSRRQKIIKKTDSEFTY
jgi:hypothetical protein